MYPNRWVHTCTSVSDQKTFLTTDKTFSMWGTYSGDILKWCGQILPSVSVRGSGSVYPSPPCSRGSAQGFLGVSNLCSRGTEEKDEEDVLRVPCMAWDIAPEMEWLFCGRHNLNLSLSHAWACNIMCDVRTDCAHLHMLNELCERCTCSQTPSIARELKVSSERKKQLPEQGDRLSKSLCNRFSCARWSSTIYVLLFSLGWRSPIIPILIRLPIVVLPVRGWDELVEG